MVSPYTTEESFLAALARNPNDVIALDGLGMLAARTGRLDAALSALSRAAELAPHDAQIQIHLAHVFHDRGEWEVAQLQYARALYLAPDDALAHEGASYTAMRLDDFAKAEKHRSHAFRHRALTAATVDVAAPTVLLIISSYGGNVDTRPYLAGEPINVMKLIAEELHQVSDIPEFDYAFNGMADGSRRPDSLHSLRAVSLFLDRCNKPILNHPEDVMKTTRSENARRFATLAHVVAPRTITVHRSGDAASLAFLISCCLPFPFLLRAPGYHTGEHFYRVNTLNELEVAIAKLPGEELLAMEFVDTSDEAGIFRKYRMMTVDGMLYPAHLAVSDSWKVHYKNAQTTAVAAYRAEEAHFLANPETVIGERAMLALAAISQMMNLDYAGIDFSIDRGGNVVCFEANATMVVPLPGNAEEDRHRRVAAQNIHHATKRLLWL